MSEKGVCYIFAMSKLYFIKQVLEEVGASTKTGVRVLDLGCGNARYVPELLDAFPDITYVGLEPKDSSYAAAEQLLTDDSRATLYKQLGYEKIDGVDDASFDIVFSLSVLEHVKDLDSFIKMSVRYTKSGGHVVHRYDLGHALYPHSLKEQFHVFLGNTIPQVLPERRFVRYVPLMEVEQTMGRHLGVVPYRHSFHGLTGTKAIENIAAGTPMKQALKEINVWEFTHQDAINTIPLAIREKSFPTVAVWGKKQ